MYTEETASPGLWKSEIVGLLGVCAIGAAFLVPGGETAVYACWAIGAVATNAALAMSGNRKWERPVAVTAAIWLFISGFVPSVLHGRIFMLSALVAGALLVVAAVSANVHLRDDIRHHRPLAM